MEHRSRSIDELLEDDLEWEQSYKCLRKSSTNLTYQELMTKILPDKKSTIKWCFDNQLLANQRQCPFNMTLQREASQKASSHALIWRCRRKISGENPHDKTISIKRGSFFAGSNLNLREVLHLTYGFSHGWDQQMTMHETALSDKTVVDWYSFCREVATQITLETSQQLGGPGRTVEIDESKFGKRKYHRGHHVEGQWVFGGIDRDSGQIFMIPVEKRDRYTLLPIIKEWIKPGTTIISDYWKAYDCLDDEGYRHLKVNHSINYKDPDTGAHTNTIEGSWLHAKRSLPKYGTKKSFMAGYFGTFIWRRMVRIQAVDPFMELIWGIKKVYNPNDWRMPNNQD
jgi:transposase-like protein